MNVNDLLISTEERAAELKRQLLLHPAFAKPFEDAGWAPTRWVDIPMSFRRFQIYGLEYEEHYHATAILRLFGGLRVQHSSKDWGRREVVFEIGAYWNDVPERLSRSQAFGYFVASEPICLPVCERMQEVSASPGKKATRWRSGR